MDAELTAERTRDADAADAPIFGEFDDELAAEVLARHVDAGTTTGEVAFIDELDATSPVASINVDGDRLTPDSRDWLVEHAGDHDIVVGFALPSGRITVDTFDEPDAGDWEESRFNQFLASVGASPAALEEAVGREAEIDLSAVEESESRWSPVRSVGAFAGIALVGHGLAALLAGAHPMIAFSAGIWMLVAAVLLPATTADTDS